MILLHCRRKNGDALLRTGHAGLIFPDRRGSESVRVFEYLPARTHYASCQLLLRGSAHAPACLGWGHDYRPRFKPNARRSVIGTGIFYWRISGFCTGVSLAPCTQRSSASSASRTSRAWAFGSLTNITTICVRPCWSCTNPAAARTPSRVPVLMRARPVSGSPVSLFLHRAIEPAQGQRGKKFGHHRALEHGRQHRCQRVGADPFITRKPGSIFNLEIGHRQALGLQPFADRPHAIALPCRPGARCRAHRQQYLPRHDIVRPLVDAPHQLSEGSGLGLRQKTCLWGCHAFTHNATELASRARPE